ncbi:MAG TPA: hypothetical protein PLD30_02555 [Candidatus Competibacteraceae bacterium]|nr:hypothetical protein [Candidatus Competibacteraceae bacterium]
MIQRTPLSVLLTVDTEMWPLVASWPRWPLPAEKTDFALDYDIYVRGMTRDGEFGLSYLLRVLGEHGLKACFFVESLHALAIGSDLLRQTVDDILAAGQEAQLHIHTEWLGDCDQPGLPKQYGPAIAGYSLSEQEAILRAGVKAFSAVGAPAPVAYRAGSYAASLATLGILPQLGITIDSSHNACHAEWGCTLAKEASARDVVELAGVLELPVTCFQDYPGHVRHLQVCAVSFAEMRAMLEQAWQSGWQAVVIVLHSSEFSRKQDLSSTSGLPSVDHRLAKRFERLCDFLARDTERFRTGWINEQVSVAPSGQVPPLRSRLHRTVLRHLAQAASRLGG